MKQRPPNCKYPNQDYTMGTRVSLLKVQCFFLYITPTLLQIKNIRYNTSSQLSFTSFYLYLCFHLWLTYLPDFFSIYFHYLLQENSHDRCGVFCDYLSNVHYPSPLHGKSTFSCPTGGLGCGTWGAGMYTEWGAQLGSAPSTPALCW